MGMIYTIRFNSECRKHLKGYYAPIIEMEIEEQNLYNHMIRFCEVMEDLQNKLDYNSAQEAMTAFTNSSPEDKIIMDRLDAFDEFFLQVNKIAPHLTKKMGYDSPWKAYWMDIPNNLNPFYVPK